MNIAEILTEQARARPHASAIIDSWRGRDRATTFAQLDETAARAAEFLWRRGLRPGDAVLVLQPMSMELYVALLALFRLGLVAMFLDPSAGREHIENCCELWPPRGFIGSTKAHLLRMWTPALARIPAKFVIGWPVPGAFPWSQVETTPPRRSIVPCETDTPALLTFTSGSTGFPKAVVRTHGILRAQHRVLVSSLELSAGSVDLTTLPIVLLVNLATGVTSVIPDADLRYPGSVDPGPVFAQVSRHRVVSSAASPAFFERLVRHGMATGETLPTLTKVFSGGAPVFPRLLDQMQALAPNAEVVAVYGSTEAEPIAHVARHAITEDDTRAMLAGKGLLAGCPVESIRLCILRDQWGTSVGPYEAAEFHAHFSAADEPGEIVVHGEHVLTGYHQGRGDADTKFRVGEQVWHRTGDAGYLDARGRLWLLGRCSARIADSRGVLYPFAVETAVYQDPRVRRAALVTHGGRRLLAVEFHEGTGRHDATEIEKAVAWARLDEVRILQSVPVDARHNAKVDYPRLRQLLDG